MMRLRPIPRQARQTIERSLVKFGGTIDGAQYPPIAFGETGGIHSRDEVERAVSVVTCALCQEPSLALQTSPELRVRKRHQQADHRHRDGALAYEINLP